MCSCPLWGNHQPWLPFFCFATEHLINDALLPDNCSPSLINFIIFGIWNFSVIISIKNSHTHTFVVSVLPKTKTLLFSFIARGKKGLSLSRISKKTFRYYHNYPQSPPCSLVKLQMFFVSYTWIATCCTAILLFVIKAGVTTRITASDSEQKQERKCTSKSAVIGKAKSASREHTC